MNNTLLINSKTGQGYVDVLQTTQLLKKLAEI
nr:MAG TPA_asm: hypothetical protein [Caudoviricetes sp.]